MEEPQQFGPYYVEDPSQPYNRHLTVMILPIDEIERLTLAARHHAATMAPNPNDNRGGNLNYPVTEREMVSLIRHCLINRTFDNDQPTCYIGGYDNMLHRIGLAGGNVAERQLDLKLNIFRLIAQYYPTLAQECDYQAWQLQFCKGRSR